MAVETQQMRSRSTRQIIIDTFADLMLFEVCFVAVLVCYGVDAAAV